MENKKDKDGLSLLKRRLAAGSMALCMAVSALPATAEAAAVQEHSVRPLTEINDISYNETTADTHDPYRGFYHAKQINFTRDMKNCDKVEDALEEVTEWVGPKRVKKNEEEFYLVHLRIDLSDFSAGPDHDSDAEINSQNDDVEAALRKLLDGLRANGQTAIIRFAYDKSYAGNTSGSSRSVWEPVDEEKILRHQEKVGAVLNEYTDVIACLETGLIGPWGEMHGSERDSREPVQKFVQKWLDVLDDDITVNVRRPQHYCWYIGKDKDQTESMLKQMSDPTYKTKAGDDEYRVGIFNDGYLGSASDRGTFVGDRDEEIAWIGSQAQHTLYGGEIAAWHASEDDGSKNVSPKNNVDYMTQESFLTHTSYLNKGWNETVTDVFREKDYKTDDSEIDAKRDPVYLEEGIKQYDYLRNHMGYRFVVDGVSLTKETSVYENFSIKANILNVGFANMVKDEKASLIIKGSNGYTKEYDLSDLDASIGESATNYDPRNWNSGEDMKNKGKTEFTATVDIPDNFPTGDYKVYLKIAYNKKNPDQAEYPVHFANEGTNVFDGSLNANFLGNFQIVAGTKPDNSSSKISSSSSKAPVASSSKAPVASSSKKPVASSSKKPVASSSKKPVASSSKKPVASSSKKPVASSSKKPVASSSKKPVASSSKNPAASSSKKPVASSSKKPVASSSKKPVASSSKKPVASSSKKPVASSSKKPVASSSKKPVASSSKKPVASSSKKPVASSSKKPVASSSKKPVASSSKKPVASSSKKPATLSSKAPVSSSFEFSSEALWDTSSITDFTESSIYEDDSSLMPESSSSLGEESAAESIEESTAESVEETEHSFGDWKVREKPSCTIEGTEVRVCQICGDTEERNIPALGHDLELIAETAPADGNDGSKLYVCKNCGSAHTEVIPWNEASVSDIYGFLKGDADCNGTVNVTDIAVIAAHIKGIKPLVAEGLKRADADGDGSINVTDIAMVAAHIKGIKPLA